MKEVSRMIEITIRCRVDTAEGQTDEELLAYIKNEEHRLGTNLGPVGPICYWSMAQEWLECHGLRGNGSRIKRSYRIVERRSRG
jgi:hypothetical protein